MKCPYAYLYHNKVQCRCVQEEAKCNNDTDLCDKINGRCAYEDDLWEEGFWSRLIVIRNIIWRNL